MKRTFLAIIALFLSIQALPQNSDFGIGLILGNPTGFSVKYWTGEKTSIAASIGYHIGHIDHLRLNADFLIHNWSFDSEQDLIRIYFGPGVGLGFISELSISVRAPVGVAYFFHTIPIEAFAEMVPTLQIIGPEDIDFRMGGYIGARWYF